MKTLAFAACAALSAGTAFAHTSLVPHEHPHQTSILPDIVALFAAAAFVAVGLLFVRNRRKTR